MFDARIAFLALLPIFFFIFINFRNKNEVQNKSDQLEFFQKYLYDCDDMFEHVKLIEKCRKNGPIAISFNYDRTFIDNSKILLKSGLIHQTVCDNMSQINLCGNGNNCKSVDLRIFIQSYFKESKNVIFRTYGEQDLHSLFRDSEGVLNKRTDGEELLKALGLILGLAVVTETFIDTAFVPHFYVRAGTGPVEASLNSDLIYVNREQFKIYREIKDALHDEKFRFIPDSTEPFGRPIVGDDSNLFSAEDFPLFEAAKQIFYYPFKKSTSLITDGISIIFNNKSQDPDRFEDFNRLLMGHMLSDYGQLDISDWKDNSDYDKSTKLFWEALRNLEYPELMKIYTKVTGLKRVPRGGFGRLLRTKIVLNENLGMFEESYKINLKKYSNSDELAKDLKFNI